MTGWSRSFMLALKAIIVGFVFAIIGVIIMAFGVGLIYLGARDYLAGVGPIKLTAWIGVPVAIFGFIFSSIGFYAALIKFTIDEAVKEAQGPTLTTLKTQSSTSIRTCPNCRTPLQWVESAKRWYCPNCKEYIP